MNFSIKNPQLNRTKLIASVIAAIIIAIAAWAYSEKVYKQRLAAANTDITTITQNMRKLFLHSPTVDISGTADMKLNAIDSGSHIYIESDVFPKPMIAPDRKTALNPWGGAVAVTQATLTQKGDGFYLYFDQLSKRACIDVLVANGVADANTGLRAIGVGPSGLMPQINNTDLPMSSAMAQSLCINPKNALGFAYALHPNGIPPEPTIAPAPKHQAAPKHETEKTEPVQEKAAEKPAAPAGKPAAKPAVEKKAVPKKR